MRRVGKSGDVRVIEGYDGILFIGDVHLSSKRPGRRVDDYAKAGLNKLSQCATIARERNLYPVFLGDLFHRAGENNLSLLAEVIRVCKEFPEPLLVLGGSHDRTEIWFTEKDAAYMMQAAGAVALIDEPGLQLVLRVGDIRVALWASPAGSRIPDEVSSDADRTILITHHDFDFVGEYPGSIPLKEIVGCDMLVNGHMHTPAPSVIKGTTVCHNPGSITRVSVDLKDHKPVVTAWTPAQGVSLEKIPLVVASNVFDLTGKEVYAADARDLKASLPKGLRFSTFAAKLRTGGALEAQRSDDGAILIEEVEHYFSTFDKPDNLKRYILSLVQDTVAVT